MKIAVKIAFMAAATIPAAASAQEAGRMLSLDEAVAVTLTENPALKAAAYEERAAQQQRRAAIGLRMPQINVTGAYAYKGTVISTVFAIIVAGGCYFLGGFGRLYSDKIAINEATGKPLFDTIIPTMLSTLPAIIIAIVIVLVLSASMSTLSSLVLTSSSTFTLDVIVPVSKKKMNEMKQVVIMRIFIVFFIVVSAVIAIFKDSHPEVTFIAQMMGVSWGALAGAFLAPFLYGLYWKGVTKAATVVCFVWGCAVAVLQLIVSLCGIDVTGWGTVFGYIFKSSINSGVVAMVGGLIIVPVISLITKKQSKEEIDNMFQCYEAMVEVPVKESLED